MGPSGAVKSGFRGHSGIFTIADKHRHWRYECSGLCEVYLARASSGRAIINFHLPTSLALELNIRPNANRFGQTDKPVTEIIELFRSKYAARATKG
jgi:hypothetical protein